MPKSPQAPVTKEEDSPHSRLLRVGKQLFAVHGFEKTSTAAIARAAKTSESQLIKHFQSKEGLLEAIFDEGWRRMSYIFTALQVVKAPQEKLRMMLELMLNAFESDPALKELMLLEGRRLRKGDSTLVVTEGYLQFVTTLDSILESLSKQGVLRPNISVEGLRSAMIGMMEGMLRDQVLARRVGYPANFGIDELRTVFTVLLEGCLRTESSDSKTA